jgi:hypothetical protein
VRGDFLYLDRTYPKERRDGRRPSRGETDRTTHKPHPEKQGAAFLTAVFLKYAADYSIPDV